MTTPSRTIYSISGSDRNSLLGGLVTNDAQPGKLVYSALLTPQGKFLADFFLLEREEDILLDVSTSIAPQLVQRLSMYKLRADVTIAEAELAVTRGISEPAPIGAYPDPRHPALGWRCYGNAQAVETVDWDAIRVAHCVPETGIELLPNDTYILEAGFERLGGVDHRKGCYVGQEVTARMKHKTELRKGFVTVGVAGDAAPGTEITANGKTIGQLFTRVGDQAIAYLRFDRVSPEMQAGAAAITFDQT